jgi:hypothetical protein
MKLKTYLLTASTILILNSAFTFRDDPIVNKLLAYKKLTDKHNIEKIHIHTNQPYYTANDTIWFKTYVLNAYFNRPSDVSKDINIELVNEQGKVVNRVKLALKVGLADGYLPLTKDLKTGAYRLKAYTGQMKYFGPEYYYTKNLVIKNRTNPASATPSATKQSEIQFFPEGGDMVNGVKSVVAFKAIAGDGAGANVKGSIVDEGDNTVASFASTHLGMGSFVLTPATGHQYFAKVSDGSSAKVALPKALDQGYTVQLTHGTDSIRVKVLCSADLKNKGRLMLVGSQDGITRSVNQLVLTNTERTLLIPETSFYPGVAQFTLFDTDNKPVAERLVFISKDQLTIKAEVKPTAGKHEQLKIPLSLKNINNTTEVGSLSVAVYNETEYPFAEENESTILSDLLLTGDLKGYIESPNYYFSGTANAEKAQHLDELLLTQGWRRFSWKDVLSRELLAVADTIPPGIEVAGNITSLSKKPYANGDLTLYRSRQLQDLRQTTTDDKGHYAFSNLSFADTARFVLSTNTVKAKKDLLISIWKPDSISNIKAAFPYQAVLKDTSVNAFNRSLTNTYNNTQGTLLNNVNVTVSTKKKLPVESTGNLNGSGRADAIVIDKDLTTTVNLLTYLTNNIAGLKQYDGKVYNRTTPDVGSLEVPAPMLIILDGAYLTQDNWSIADYDPNNVGSIEILKTGATTAMYGIDGSGGVLVITSKRGKDYASLGIAKGILPLTLIGYQSHREFYSPKYEVKTPRNSGLDYRKALYWNPSVIAGLKDQTEISFSTSDYVGKYKVVIEGINADGLMAREIYHFEVK